MYYDNSSLCAVLITEVYILLTLDRFESFTIVTNTSKFADCQWLIPPRLACFYSKCLTYPKKRWIKHIRWITRPNKPCDDRIPRLQYFANGTRQFIVKRRSKCCPIPRHRSSKRLRHSIWWNRFVSRTTEARLQLWIRILFDWQLRGSSELAKEHNNETSFVSFSSESTRALDWFRKIEFV